MRKQSFIAGAVILTLAGLISRILGAMYRIPLSRLIGPEGIGLYEMAYPVYGILLVMSTAGIPVAISKLVSEKMALGDSGGARQVFRVSLFILTLTGLSCSLLLFWSARFLADHFLGDSRVYYSIISIAPAILFVTIMSAYRGFYQGLQLMTPTAISQVVEQFIRMLTMLCLVYLLLPRGVDYSAAGATFGAVTGAAAGLLSLLFIHWQQKKKLSFFSKNSSYLPRESNFRIAYRIFYFSIPIILGGLAVPLMHMINAILVPVRLQVAGYTMREATNLYGQLTGMAFTLMHFPTIITAALAASLVPAISESFALNRRKVLKFQAQEAIRLTLVVSLPAAMGLYTLAREICQLLFACPSAGIPLQFLAFGTIFLCLHESISAVLQGIGKTAVPVRNLFLGAGANILGIFIFTALPNLAIRGAAISTAGGFMLAASLDLLAVNKLLKIRLPLIDLLLKPCLCAWMMGLAVRKVYNYFFLLWASNFLSTFLAVLAGIVVYLLLMLVLGGIKRRDLEMIPKVGPLCINIFSRLGLLGLIRS